MYIIRKDQYKSCETLPLLYYQIYSDLHIFISAYNLDIKSMFKPRKQIMLSPIILPLGDPNKKTKNVYDNQQFQPRHLKFLTQLGWTAFHIYPKHKGKNSAINSKVRVLILASSIPTLLFITKVDKTIFVNKSINQTKSLQIAWLIVRYIRYCDLLNYDHISL